MASAADLVHLCLTCLKEDNGENMDSVFSEVTFVDGNIASCSFLQLIDECTQVKVDPNDKKPKKICIECIDAVTKAYMFRVQTQQSNKWILSTLGEDEQRPSGHVATTQTENVTIYPCEMCSKLYYTEKELRKHRNVHRWKPLICRFCNQEFLKLVNLQGHLLKYHPASQIRSSGFAKKHSCPICFKLLIKKELLEKHLKIHKEDIKYMGDIEDNPHKEVLLKILNNSNNFYDTINAAADFCDDDDDSISASDEDNLFSDEDDQSPEILENIKEELIESDVPNVMLKVVPIYQTTVEYNGKEEITYEEMIEENDNEQTVLDEQDEQSISYKCESCTVAYSNFSGTTKEIIHHGFDGHKCPYCKRIIMRYDNFDKHVSMHYKEKRYNPRGRIILQSPRVLDAEIKVSPLPVERKKVGRPKKVSLIRIEPASTVEEVTEINVPADEFYEHIENDFNKIITDPGDEDGDEEFLLNDSSNDETVEEIEDTDTNDKSSLARCPHCEKYYASRRSLQSHIYDQHMRAKPADPFVCEVCNKTYASEKSLRSHQREQHDMHQMDNHPCPHCDKVIQRLDNFKRHLMTHAEPKSVPKDEKSPGRKSKTFCTICQKSFLSAYYYKDHMKSHEEPAYVCEQCGERFHSKVKLNSHTRIHRGPKEYLCPECGKCFSKGEYLKVHIMRHNGIKPFTCNYCDKNFVSKSEVRLHERYHTNQRIRECEICKKQFHRMTSLTIHMRTHTGERPYACTHCDKRFTQRNDMKTHVRREHTGEKFSCELCEAAFVQQYHLTQHLRQTHNMDVKSHIGRVRKVSVPIKRLPNPPGRKKESKVCAVVKTENEDDMKVMVPFNCLDMDTMEMTSKTVEIGIKPLL